MTGCLASPAIGVRLRVYQDVDGKLPRPAVAGGGALRLSSLCYLTVMVMVLVFPTVVSNVSPVTLSPPAALVSTRVTTMAVTATTVMTTASILLFMSSSP